METIWQRLVQQAAACPLDIAFNPAAGEAEIAAAEAEIGLAFPNDLRRYLLCANGEAWNSDGLIGDWRLLSLQDMVRESRSMKRLVDEGVLGDNANDPTPYVKGLWWNPRWIPIVSSGSGHLICLDMDPAPDGRLGQVILFLHDDADRPLIAHSLADWLARIAADLEGGLYQVVEDEDGYRHFDGHALMWSSLEDKGLYDSLPLPALLADLLDVIGRDLLQTLLFDPVAPGDLDWHLARLGRRVAPAYLPLATDDSGALAIHLWPGRRVHDAPIVYIGEDQSQVYYMCDALYNLPTALWLWVGRYLGRRLPDLRRAVGEMAERIPGGRPVPEALWTVLQEAPPYEPTWWFADGQETTQRAWQLAGVGHPFVGLPDPGRRARPEEALALLAPFVEAHRAPELVSLVLAAQLKAGQEVRLEDVLLLLSAEAWRQSGCLLSGRWRVRGEGLCAWDAVLRHLPDRRLLAATPFAPLIDHPAAYSGADPEGPLALGRVAVSLRKEGDPPGALRQFRNAMHVAVWALGRPPRELVLAAAEACDAIARDSPAGAVARRSAAGSDRML